jgi:antitoxin component HigA of HigAB toxin-antitoxin module
MVYLKFMAQRKHIKQVREYLDRTGLKPYELEQLAGVSRGLVYDFLADRRKIKLESWLKLERIINRA